MPHHAPVKYVETIRPAPGDGEHYPLVVEPSEFITYTDKDGEPFRVAFACPCGCGSNLFLRVTNSKTKRPCPYPAWDYKTNGMLLSPSIRDVGGCKAHFHIKRDGTVDWCGDSGQG